MDNLALYVAFDGLDLESKLKILSLMRTIREEVSRKALPADESCAERPVEAVQNPL